MQGPWDFDPLCVAVLLCSVQPSARGLQAPRFVSQKDLGLIAADRREDELTILAQPGFDKVAAIIVLGHPYRIPYDPDLIPRSTGPNVARRLI